MLEFESGLRFENATAQDIEKNLEGEEFAVLGGETHYMQAAEQTEPPYEYILEYREGGPQRHFAATDHPIALPRVISAFVRYLKGDDSWKLDFTWERIELE